MVNLAVLIASIAVCIKRLHDRDRSGWWLLLFYAGPVGVALVGGFIFWAAAAADAVGANWDWSFLGFGSACSPVLRSPSGASSKSAACAALRDITASGRTRSNRACCRRTVDLQGIDRRRGVPDVPAMSRSITIDARWDAEASVWIATSNDVPGLVVEVDTWPTMIEEVRLVLPDLLELSGERTDKA